MICGTKPYDGYPKQEEYFAEFTPDKVIENFGLNGEAYTRDIFYKHMPVHTGGNIYFNGARPCDCEEDYYIDDKNQVAFEFYEKDGKYYLNTDLYDYLGNSREEETIAGPFADYKMKEMLMSSALC